MDTILLYDNCGAAKILWEQTGNVMFPPFPDQAFDLVTASNLLFLLPDPLAALQMMARLLRFDRQIATLNPSEYLTMGAATNLADMHNLNGLARESLLNWAGSRSIPGKVPDSESQLHFHAHYIPWNCGSCVKDWHRNNPCLQC